MLPAAMLYSSLLPHTMVLGCCLLRGVPATSAACYPEIRLHEAIAKGRVGSPTVSAKDSIQRVSKQRAKQPPAFILSVWWLSTAGIFAHSPARDDRGLHVLPFSLTQLMEVLKHLAYSRDLLLSLSLEFHSFTLLSFLEWATVSKQKNINMRYLAICISCIRRTAILLFPKFVGISSEISMKGMKNCNRKGKHS